MSDAVDHLYSSVLALRHASPERSRTAKLFRDGMPKMAKKLAEEAAEVALDAVQGNRPADHSRIRRSALQSVRPLGPGRNHARRGLGEH